MKKRSSLFIVSLLILASLILAACTPQATPVANPEVVIETVVVEKEVEVKVLITPTAAPEGPVTITFWHGYNADVEAKYLDETIIPAFEAEHPNVKVQSVIMPYDQFRRKLLIALSGGTAPDLARLDILWVPELADQGALAKMEEVLPDFEVYKEEFLPGPLSTNLYQGEHYGLPLDTNTRVLVYNKAMFTEAGIEAAPATMDEFLTACEKIKALGEDKYCFADGGTYAWAVNPWIWSFGGDVTSEDTTTATDFYNGAASVAAYQFLKDGVDKGYVHPGILGGGVDAWGGFATDTVAMLLEGPWFPPLFEGQFPDKEYGMALMPAGEGGAVSVVGGEDIVLFQQSANKEAAAEFMRYLLSEEVQLQLATTGQMPVLNSAIESDFVKNHEFFGIFLEQLKTAKARTPHPNWSQIEEVMTNTGSNILNGVIDVQEGLDQAVEQINPLLTIPE
ncbi:MAG: ABC transporter substrate-binding protein [Chloroflexi bacterium HGW-Chloroflexi-10]|nr:MAG: ABC transporter substrate-binding protein [Chloroflexi bacterium HGW-Chloroflexi-10]